jgi:3-hydroxyisobutyrate dehydrogenase
MTGDDRTIAVLGAGGIMGQPMTRNLARAGFAVRAWNRTRRKAEPLADDGAVIAGTPAKAASGADVVLTMLADTDAVLAAMSGPNGALGEMSGSSAWLQMSTIGEAGTAQCARLADRRGIPFVDAPVLGTLQPAEEGKLVILASGQDRLLDQLSPVFGSIGQRTIRLGAAGQGSRLKLVLNSWVLAVVEAGAEMITLAEAMGFDQRLIFQALENSPLDLPYLRLKSKAIMERSFEPAFRLRLAAKDAALVDEAARTRGLDLPVLTAISERLALGIAEHGEKDLCATYLTIARRPLPAKSDLAATASPW